MMADRLTRSIGLTQRLATKNDALATWYPGTCYFVRIMPVQ